MFLKFKVEDYSEKAWPRRMNYSLQFILGKE
jgi:hypothetical protein